MDDPKSDPKRTRAWLADYVGSIDEAYTVIGFEPPLDGRKAVPLLAAYERALTPALEGKGELRRRARTHGFRLRMRTRAGRAIVAARRGKGRERLSA